MSAHEVVSRCATCGAVNPSDTHCASEIRVFGSAPWRPRHTLVEVCTECGAKAGALQSPCTSACEAAKRAPEPRGETPMTDRPGIAAYHGFRSWDALARALGLDA